MARDHDRTLPFHFTPVTIAALVGLALACGLAFFALQSSGGQDSEAQAVVLSQQEMRSVRSKALTTAPQLQTVHFKHLNHDVVVGGSELGGKKLRRKLRKFQRTIRAFEEAGQRIGVVIIDLGTDSAVTYNADEDFYPASSIKGPHLISVYEQLVDTGQARLDEVNALAEPIVLYSDNEAYVELCHRYGNQTFADWAVQCDAVKKGGKDYRQMCEVNYPAISTQQLARMWRRGFEYLDEDTEGARQLQAYFEQRVESPIRAGLADADLTLSKAGWYPSYDGAGSAPSTCDAGIVLDEGRCHLVAIMTDAPADLDWLARLVPGLCSARGVLR